MNQIVRQKQYDNGVKKMSSEIFGWKYVICSRKRNKNMLF